MAWIENAYGELLIVKHKNEGETSGMWSLPGGEVLPHESLLLAVERALREGLDVEMDVATPLDLFDNPETSSFTMLYRVILKHGKVPTVHDDNGKVLFRKLLPKNSTTSAQFFWQRSQRGFEPLCIFDARANVPQPLGEEEN